MKGIPFNDSSNFDLSIARYGEAILGDNILGFQAGNEPDLYHNNQLRSPTYGAQDFTNEWQQVIGEYQQDPNWTFPNKFVAPSVCCGQDIGWKPEEVWATGFLDKFAQYLSYVSVEQYVFPHIQIALTEPN